MFRLPTSTKRPLTYALASVMLVLSLAELRGDDKVPPASQTELAARSLWDHNGSVVYLTAEQATQRFYYDTPRQGLEAVGIKRGTLLFEGRKDGDRYSGTAYFFSKQCGQRPYAVSGSVASGNSQTTITMSGQAPRLGANCQQIGVHNDVLVFSYKANVSAIGTTPSAEPALNCTHPIVANRRGDPGPVAWRDLAQEEDRVCNQKADAAAAKACHLQYDRALRGVNAYLCGDYAAAMRTLRPLAEQDHVSAMSYVGGMYMEGKAYRKMALRQQSGS